VCGYFFFFIVTPTAVIYTGIRALALHDALPVYVTRVVVVHTVPWGDVTRVVVVHTVLWGDVTRVVVVHTVGRCWLRRTTVRCSSAATSVFSQ
jgi:hypothetical protein